MDHVKIYQQHFGHRLATARHAVAKISTDLQSSSDHVKVGERLPE